MINEYIFYYRFEESPFEDKPYEVFDVNNHKVSRELFYKLHGKVEDNYKVCAVQNYFYKNYEYGSYEHSKITTFKRNNNE